MGVADVVAGKTPVVKWGQRPDKIYLTLPLPELTDPEITLDEKKVTFSGTSKGQDYEVKLKLLRGINVTASKHTMNQWNVQFELVKLKKEPCWLRLLKTKESFTWLKKDYDKWYQQECQHAKELWREAYSTAKMNGEDPSKGKSSSSPEDLAKPPPEKDKEREKKQFEDMIKEFRKKAVPRKSKEKKTKNKKAKS